MASSSSSLSSSSSSNRGTHIGGLHNRHRPPRAGAARGPSRHSHRRRRRRRCLSVPSCRRRLLTSSSSSFLPLLNGRRGCSVHRKKLKNKKKRRKRKGEFSQFHPPPPRLLSIPSSHPILLHPRGHRLRRLLRLDSPSSGPSTCDNKVSCCRYQILQRDMKPAYSDASEHAKSNEHRPSNRIFPERSLSMHARFNSQTVGLSSPSIQMDFERSSSLSRVQDVGPWRRHSLRLSRGSSSRRFEDVPSDVIAQAGDSGDRVLYDREENGITSGLDEAYGTSFRRCSFGSNRESWWKGSSRLSHGLDVGIPEDVENGFAALAGDTGNRVVTEDAHGGSQSIRLEQGNLIITENSVVPAEDGARSQRHGFQLHDKKLNECSFTFSPLNEEIVSPLPTDAILYSREEKVSTLVMQSLQSSSFKYKLPRPLDYVAYLIHMAVFGIFGVFARHLLQKLFGPGCLALTSDETPLYLDLPANMAGSFLMGWFGRVFKGDVQHVSDHLAVGLTTGFMGSLTTFSGWNQKMLDLSSKDHWVFAVAGIILGFFIVNESFSYGAASAEGLRACILNKFSQSPESPTFIPERWRVQRPSQHFTVMTVMLLILGLLWAISGVLARTRLASVTDGAVLWLACIVGPPGVWLRWYLARFNGQGLGKRGFLKWLPLGTLAANVLAALIMAALAMINKAVNTKRCGIITRGIQFGFLGCLSTVSTFAAEIYAMRDSGHEGRAFTYAAITFIPSFAMGTLIYSVPVWTRHYH